MKSAVRSCSVGFELIDARRAIWAVISTENAQMEWQISSPCNRRCGRLARMVKRAFQPTHEDKKVKKLLEEIALRMAAKTSPPPKKQASSLSSAA